MKQKNKKQPCVLQKNQIIELDITAAGSQGEGIGRHEGMAVFVPAAAEGDRLNVRILKTKKSFAYGKIESMISPSKNRVGIDCPAYPQCGGCAYRHISYEAECAIKEQRVADAMKRIGGIDLKPERFVPCEPPMRYRNKAQLPCAQGRDGTPGFGFYAGHTHRIVFSEDCLLQPQSFSEITQTVCEFMIKHGIEPYNELTHSGAVRHLYIRRSRTTGETVVCIVINGQRLPHEQELADALFDSHSDIVGVLLNTNTERTNVILGSGIRVLRGKEYIDDQLLSTRFRISPLSFFQVNPAQAEKLYAIAAEYAQLGGQEVLLDMYCGAGTIGLTMYDKVKKLIGVEVCAEAVEDAKVNAELNGAKNAEFICADAAQAAQQLRQRGISPDVVILDPPRKGCDIELLQTISEMSPERIVYVSCDPATLARDIARLAEMGYFPSRLSAVDMFPRTVHVETVTLLSRKKPDDVIDIDLDFNERMR